MKDQSKNGDGSGARAGEATSRPEDPGTALDRRAPADGGGGNRESAAGNQAWLIDAVSDGLALIDMSGGIVAVNRALEKLTGDKREDLVGRSVEELIRKNIAGSFIDEALRLWKEILSGGSSWAQSLVFTDRQGREVPISCKVSRTEDAPGSAALVVVTVRDLTELRDFRKALSRSEERFRELVDLLPEIVYEVDATGRITFINQRAFELTGYGPEDLERGMFVPELFAPGDRERLMENIGGLLAGASPRKNEYVVMKKDGSEFPVVTHSVPIMREERAVGVRGVCFDISERRQMEQTLLQTQKIEAIGTLAGGIAHDINNVLASISSLATLIKEETAPDDPRLQDIEEILSVTARGGEFTRNLLGFARRGKYRTERVSLNKMAGQVQKILERTAPKKVRIEMDLDPELAEVEGDPGQLTQVLMNLCLNAVEAVPDEGTVTVSTGNIWLEEPPGSMSPLLSPGRYVRLQVKDTGRGMDGKTLDRAFEPFFTTKEPGKGTGLGLAMVFGVVRNHRGDVLIESEPGKGTTVTALFPALEAATPEAAKPKSPLPARQEGTGTVLLVDDEQVLLSTGKRMLARLGYRVLLAGDGAAALEVFEQHIGEIDLVLLDLGMPVMDGAECFKKLKQLKSDVRVLITSGYSDSEKVEVMLENGALGFLHKPYSAEHLSRAVSRALGLMPPDRPDRG